MIDFSDQGVGIAAFVDVAADHDLIDPGVHVADAFEAAEVPFFFDEFSHFPRCGVFAFQIQGTGNVVVVDDGIIPAGFLG